MKKFMFIMVVMVMMASMPVMAKEAEIPETKEEETKTYTFSEVIEEVEYYGIEEEEVEKISSIVKKVDYREEYYELVVTYSEPSEDGFDWLSVIVYNGMVEIQGKGPESMATVEYTYRQFMDR